MATGAVTAREPPHRIRLTGRLTVTNLGVFPEARDTWVTRDGPWSAWTASRSRSSSAGQRCEYVSSVSLAFLCPSADCTALIEHPAAISTLA